VPRNTIFKRGLQHGAEDRSKQRSSFRMPGFRRFALFESGRLTALLDPKLHEGKLRMDLEHTRSIASAIA